MRFFNLPDLGEGLQEAEIIEWNVVEGEHVKTDQLMLQVETAKAIVELPSPQEADILKLCAQAGDIVQVGEPLVEFDCDEDDAGTVVGELPEDQPIALDNFKDFADSFTTETRPSIHEGTRHAKPYPASPSVIAFAHRLGVKLSNVEPSTLGVITNTAVAKVYEAQQTSKANEKPAQLKQGYEALHSAKRSMAMAVTQSHLHIPAVTLFDDADVNDWPTKEDITVRLILAMIQACKASPVLNAWFDTDALALKLSKNVNIGIATDCPEGLFVPVLHDAQALSVKKLRSTLNTMRKSVQQHRLKPEDMSGASISLSNFGTLSGRYATPMIVSPQVAIVGVGSLREEARVINGKIIARKMLPLSLTFDHRAATGGEATRFMAALIEALGKH